VLHQIIINLWLQDSHQVLVKRMTSADASDSKHYNLELLKKIPEGAEIASVLVGESLNNVDCFQYIS